MDESEEGESELAPLQNEAHAWIRRLISGEATQADAIALRHWCEQSPAHAAAFSEASQFWQAFGPAGRSLLRDERAARETRRFMSSRAIVGRRAVIGGLFAASTAGLLIIHPPLGLWPSLSELDADYRTGIGEQRKIALNNGVAVQLNTKTSISLRVEKESDAVELIAGEAAFSMADPLSKSFKVIAAGGRLSAAAGRFDVRRLEAGACVTCLASMVKVEYRDRAVTLGPRQRVTYDESGLGAIASIDPAIAAAWQNGLLIFNMTPLADVIAELNRYRIGRIILLNQTIARSPVNGRFRIDAPDQALKQIEQAFGVRSRTLPGGFVLLS